MGLLTILLFTREFHLAMFFDFSDNSHNPSFLCVDAWFYQARTFSIQFAGYMVQFKTCILMTAFRWGRMVFIGDCRTQQTTNYLPTESILWGACFLLQRCTCGHNFSSCWSTTEITIAKIVILSLFFSLCLRGFVFLRFFMDVNFFLPMWHEVVASCWFGISQTLGYSEGVV